MKKYLPFIIALFLIASPVIALSIFQVTQGGTGRSSLTSSQLIYGNGTGAVGSVATTTLTASTPLSLSNPVVKVGGSDSVLTIDTTGAWTGSAGSVANALTAGTGLSSAGTFNGSVARTFSLNLGNANTWTALQTFTNSSTTLGSFSYASSTQWFGGGLGTCSGSNFLQWSGGFYACGTPAVAGTVTSVVAGVGFLNRGLNITGSGTLNVGIATSSNPTLGQVSYWTGIGDASNPATLGSVATGTVSSSGGITTTAGRSVLGGALSIACDVASGSIAGCLSTADWTTFNNKENALTFGLPMLRTSNTVNWVGLATTSQPASSNILTSNGGAGVYGTATSTLSASAPLTGSFTQIGSGGALGCTTASSGVAGCLSSTAFDTFNNKQATIGVTFPITLSGVTLGFGGLSTSSAPTVGHLPYFSGVNTFSSVATGTISVPTGLTITANRSAVGGAAAIALDTGYVIPLQTTLDAKALGATTLTVAGTANQVTSSAGAQDISANRTWTLSFPSLIVNPNASTTLFSNFSRAYFGATATTTIDSAGNIVVPSGSNLTVTGKTDGCATWATGVLNSTGSACGSGGGASAFEIATTSDIALSQVAYISQTTGRTTLASVATSSIANGTGITVTNGSTAFVLGAQPTFNCNTASASVFGCLNASDFSKFNSATTTFSTGLTYTGATNAVTVNTSQNIATLSNLTTNGFVTTSGGTGTLSVSADPCTIAMGCTNAISFANNSIITSNSAGTALIATTSQLTVGNLIATTTTDSFFTGDLGSGTSTPAWQLQVSSSTRPQLALSDSATTDHWTFRNAGNSFYMATASPLTFATTTRPWLTFLATSTTPRPSLVGRLGIATSTPAWTFQINDNKPIFALSDESAGVNRKHWTISNNNGFLYFSTSSDIYATSTFPSIVLGPGGGGASGLAGFIGVGTTSQATFANLSLNIDSASNIPMSIYTSHRFGAAYFIHAGNGGEAWLTLSTGVSAGEGPRKFIVMQYTDRGVITGSPKLVIDGPTGAMGISTTSPWFQLTVASSTKAQLQLSDGTNKDQWVMRGVGSNLYFATSSPIGTFATSTNSAFRIDQNAQVYFPTWAISTAGNAVCYLAGNQIIGSGGATCATSSFFDKDITGEVRAEVAEYIVKRMSAVTFNYKGEDNEHYGFIAEEVAKIDREVKNKFGVDARLAEYAREDFNRSGHQFKKGDPISVEYANYTAILTVYLQNNTESTSGRIGRSVEENWQWICMGFLVLYMGFQQVQIIRIKRKI